MERRFRGHGPHPRRSTRSPGAAASGAMLRSPIVTPEEIFWSPLYQRHNQRRQEHLASLELDLAGRTVLELGAGVGDHTSFFLDRGCDVIVTEPRPENREVIRARHGGEVSSLDLEHPGDPVPADIVYCYGLLYHLAGQRLRSTGSPHATPGCSCSKPVYPHGRGWRCSRSTRTASCPTTRSAARVVGRHGLGWCRRSRTGSCAPMSRRRSLGMKSSRSTGQTRPYMTVSWSGRCSSFVVIATGVAVPD